jgi:hypothetical protein
LLQSAETVISADCVLNIPFFSYFTGNRQVMALGPLKIPRQPELHIPLLFLENPQIFQFPLSFIDDEPFFFHLFPAENLLTRKFSEVS